MVGLPRNFSVSHTATSALNFDFIGLKPCGKSYREYNVSTQVEPTLCLVLRCCLPGLPRPTIRNVIVKILVYFDVYWSQIGFVLIYVWLAWNWKQVKSICAVVPHTKRAVWRPRLLPALREYWTNSLASRVWQRTCLKLEKLACLHLSLLSSFNETRRIMSALNLPCNFTA